MLIPRIFHQIWVGPDSVPAHLLEYQKTWRSHHPHWEFRLWTEENLPASLRRPEAYDKLRVPAERADILRLDLLWRYGGVYVDADFECRRPLDPLLADLDFFATYLKPGRVANALIGAVPGHPILDCALNEIRPREFFGFDKAGTGTLFFTDVLSRFPEARSFDPPLFYPATDAELEVAYAVHHSERSWSPDGWRDAAIESEKRLSSTIERLERIDRQRADWKRKALAARDRLERRSPRGLLKAVSSALRRGSSS